MSQLTPVLPPPPLHIEGLKPAVVAPPKMALPQRPTVIIVSDRPQMAERLQAALRSYRFNVGVCLDPRNAPAIFNRKKLDGVLFDWSNEQSPALLAKLRASASNRSAIVCAIADQSTDLRSAFLSGCNLILDQPSIGNLQRILRVMHGLIVKEHRHYVRCDGNLSVTLNTRDLDNATVDCLNLSETGIAIRTPLRLPEDTGVKVNIDLLDGTPAMQLEARVRRAEAGGKFGLNFVSVPVSIRARLQAWIETRVTAMEKQFLEQRLVCN